MCMFYSSNETVLTFHVTPSTADDKEKQFVYCDLKFIIDNQVRINVIKTVDWLTGY